MWVCGRCGGAYPLGPGRCLEDGGRLVRDRAGELLAGRYRLESVLGAGGMGSVVWQATQLPTARPVAIKLLPPTDRVGRERFQRGSRIASNLNHPNIATVHDFGQTGDGSLFLVMELLKGVELRDALAEAPRMTFERVLRLTELILRGLSHAHRRGVVHRDLKPSNLFLVPHEEEPEFVKIIDFGISKLVSGAGAGELTMLRDLVGSELSGGAEVCGTPEYMAPEQIRNGQIEPATDLYALGVVLYRMICGRLPFEGRAKALFDQHTSTPPVALGQRVADVPPALERVVMRALEKNPVDRWHSASEMRAALAEVRQQLGLESSYRATDSLNLPLIPTEEDALEPSGSGPSLSAPPPPPPPRRWSRSALAVGLGAALALLAGLSWTLGARQERHRAGARPAPLPVPLLVQTDPPGATVYDGPRQLGWTPFSSTLPAGQHSLRLRLEGYHEAEITASIDASNHDPIVWRVKLRPAAERPRPEGG